MRKLWHFAQTQNPEDIKSKRLGVTEYGQRYAQCEEHENV
jgi:hypothetical protein